MLFQKEFIKSINNFKEPGEVSDKYKKEVASKISKINKLYSEKGLSKSNIFTTYKEYANLSLNSTKEEVWIKLDKIQQLLEKIIQPQNSILFSSQRLLLLELFYLFIAQFSALEYKLHKKGPWLSCSCLYC